MRQPGSLLMAIPVMLFARRLALAHLSADGAAPGRLAQDVGATWRRRVQGQLPVTGLAVRLPAGITWIGVPPDRQRTRGFDDLLPTVEPRAGLWSGEPPRLPQVMGNVAGGDPASGFVRVAPLVFA